MDRLPEAGGVPVARHDVIPSAGHDERRRVRRDLIEIVAIDQQDVEILDRSHRREHTTEFGFVPWIRGDIVHRPLMQSSRHVFHNL